MIRIVRWIGAGLAGLLALAVLVVVGAGLAYDLTPARKTAGGLRQDSALYLRMSDGKSIAADVFLPPSLAAGARAPVLIKATPYWRAYRLGFLGKAIIELGIVPAPGDSDIAQLNRRGYAVIAVDTRGTGASFGFQPVSLGDREIADYGEIIAWAARQAWSNGNVGAYGFSYRGMLANRMAALGAPALKAIAPSFDFIDLYLAVHPGGVFARSFIHRWSEQTAKLNRGEVPCEGLICHLLVTGPKPVDADSDGRQMAAAIAEHRGDYDVEACAAAAPARDMKICASGKSLDDVSPLAGKAAIEASRIPLYVVAGWFDEGSPAQVLTRFQTFANPQTVVIGALSHGGFASTDPGRQADAPPDPSVEAQVAAMADFFDATLKGGERPAAAKSVAYFVLGAGAWRKSAAWPPPGSSLQPWYLQASHGLAPQKPDAPDGADAYGVDFRVSSGPLTRYRSPVDLTRTAWPDRAAQDRRLLAYDSAPAAQALEIAGDPVAHLLLASSAADGEVIVYLEDVAPSGAVAYLTEGVLRLGFRKPGLSGGGGVDPLHSYLARDLAPMIPGRLEAVDIALSPIAARIAPGHRIRLAIAGADAGNLDRFPAAGPEILTVARNSAAASFVDLPLVGGAGGGN